MAIGIIYALCNMLGFGLHPVFGKKLTAKVGPYLSGALIHSVMILVVLCLAPFFFTPFTMTTKGWLFFLIILITGTANAYLIYYALGKGEASVVYSIIQLYPVAIALIAPFMFDDLLTWSIFIAIAVIVLGAILVSRNGTQSHKGFADGLLPSLGVMALFVIFNLLAKEITTQIGGWNGALLMEGTLGVAIVVVALLIDRDYAKMKGAWREALMAGLVFSFGAVFLYLGLFNNTVTVFSAISGASPLVAAIGAHFFLKERLKTWQYVGILLIVLGIAALALL